MGQIIDQPGAYREETATAMLISAMARGIRLHWIGQSYELVAQRALSAHVVEDGTLVSGGTSQQDGECAKAGVDAI